MEFHFGICVTKVLDFKVEAENREEAEQKFGELSKEGKLNTLPQAQLDMHVEVLGMIEGPLPTPPSGEVAEHKVPGGEVLH